MATDKRVRIVIANLKQMLQEYKTQLLWIDTLQMLADGLTKLDADCEILMRSMDSCEYSILATEESRQLKERTKASRQRARELRNAAKS